MWRNSNGWPPLDVKISVTSCCRRFWNHSQFWPQTSTRGLEWGRSSHKLQVKDLTENNSRSKSCFKHNSENFLHCYNFYCFLILCSYNNVAVTTVTEPKFHWGWILPLVKGKDSIQIIVVIYWIFIQCKLTYWRIWSNALYTLKLTTNYCYLFKILNLQ